MFIGMTSQCSDSIEEKIVAHYGVRWQAQLVAK